MGSWSEAKARGVVPKTPINVCYDGMLWQKNRSEEHRYCTVAGVRFDARLRGPRCWSLTAHEGGEQVLRTLVTSLNMAKLRAALFLRERSGAR